MASFLYFLLLAATGNSFLESSFKQIRTDILPWPNQTVYYSFYSNYTKEEIAKINQGVAILRENTCINFIEGETDNHVIKIIKEDGCFSNPGFYPYDENDFQPLSLNPHGTGKCLAFIGITVHEFLHALGMMHTQARNDRDDYITLNFTNMKDPREVSQYEKQSNLNITPYDYTSYMHYAAFPNGDHRSLNVDVPTIVTNDERYRKTIGNLRGSFYDFHAINTFYKCYDKCADSPPVECFNGGVPHPRHCHICLCPPGFGGNFCDQRSTSCGKTFKAIPDKPQKMSISIGEENKMKEFAPTECTHWIEAPQGHRIKIMLTGVKHYGHTKRTRAEKASCRFNGFEFKVNKDPRLGGPIFCDPEDWGTILISDLNPAPLILFSYEGKQEYEIRYTAVADNN